MYSFKEKRLPIFDTHLTAYLTFNLQQGANASKETAGEDFVRSNVPPVGSFPTSVKLREDGANLRQIGTTCLCKSPKDRVFMISKKTIAKDETNI